MKTYDEYDFQKNVIINTRGVKGFEICEWVINRIMHGRFNNISTRK